jgi:hypothetical protein
LRPLGRRPDPDAAGRMRRGRRGALAALRVRGAISSRIRLWRTMKSTPIAKGGDAAPRWWWPRAACRSPRSAPPISATGWRGSLACKLVEHAPGLVPLTFDGAAWAPYAQLAGLALPVQISTGTKKQRTTFRRPAVHAPRPVGPAVLQISSYWQPGTPIVIDLAAGRRPGGRAGATPRRAARKADRQRTGRMAAAAPGRRLGAARRRLAAPHRRGQRQGAGATGRAPVALGAAPTGTEGYKQGRGHRWAAWIRANCRRKPWRPRRSPACTSSARWWT